jgi:putative transposase
VRRNRIKIDPSRDEACYHCVTRTVNGEFLFDERSKETLRRMIWKVADFCGVQILTYAVLSNHFHVLIRVPRKGVISDEELLRRYSVLHPEPTSYHSARLSTVRAQLAENDPSAQKWRSRQLALMGDISQFMKLLKQRFSIWYNKNHQRFGTLWAERFRSVLIQSTAHLLTMIAAYIDLNAVRAGLVGDPKDYRFCGYAEAVAGGTVARSGLQWIFGAPGWEEMHSSYRLLLFSAGSAGRDGAAGISPSDFASVVARNGKLPLSSVLLCRVRYFTRGAVLGGQEFVHAHVLATSAGGSGSRERRVIPLPQITDWGDLATLVAVRL